MIIYIDIDNTICKTENSDYRNSIPMKDRIKKINKLYDEGHNITYWTARGNNSGKNLEDFTKNQLKTWGCKYHSLKLKKPSYDLFIDDKNINSEIYFN